MKAYKLTPSNRHLADFFQSIVIDEENSVLWSEQDLSQFGCKIIGPDRCSLPAACLPDELPMPLAIFIVVPILLAFWCAGHILTVCESFPSRRIKDLASFVRIRWFAWNYYIG